MSIVNINGMRRNVCGLFAFRIFKFTYNGLDQVKQCAHVYCTLWAEVSQQEYYISQSKCSEESNSEKVQDKMF